MPVVKSTMDNPPAAADPLATPLAASLGRRGMATPALLFVAAHRPLAFAAGHLLALAAPMAAMLGVPRVMEWSLLLASPEGVDRLVAALAVEDQRSIPRGEQRA
jgi:hypothetical protein